MKKNLILAALAAMAIVPANAQKLDKKSLSSISLSGYPQCPIRLNHTTYAQVDENGQSVALEPVGNGLYASSKRIEWTKVTEGADVVFRYSGITEAKAPIEVVREEDVYTFLTQRGKHPVKVKVLGHRFKAFGYKTVGFFVDASTDDGLVYSDSLFRIKEYESPYFDNTRQAKAFVDSLYALDDNSLRISSFCLKNVAQELNGIVASKTGLEQLDSYRFHVYSVKATKKDKYDYSDLITAAGNFEKAAKIIDRNDTKTADFEAMVAPCLSTWLNTLANASDQRISKELRAALLYNVATYHALLKDFEKASEYFAMAQKEKPGFADAEKLTGRTLVWAKAKERYGNMMADFESNKNK